MKLKAFGIFCLSFLMTTALSSCDSDEITDQPGEVSGSGNPTMTVLAEQVAGNDGYDENGIAALYQRCTLKDDISYLLPT